TGELLNLTRRAGFNLGVIVIEQATVGWLADINILIEAVPAGGDGQLAVLDAQSILRVEHRIAAVIRLAEDVPPLQRLRGIEVLHPGIGAGEIGHRGALSCSWLGHGDSSGRQSNDRAVATAVRDLGSETLKSSGLQGLRKKLSFHSTKGV